MVCQVHKAALAVLVLLAWSLAVVAPRAIPASYPQSLANVLISEGGAKYTNHPNDPGGPTKFGITLRDVRAYIDANATAATVKALTYEQAASIYEGKYWLHRCVRGDVLPAGLDYAVFDYGVNAGPGRAGLVLRRLLAQSHPNVLTDRCELSDGVLALVKQKEPPALIRALQAERRRFYRNLIAQKPSLGTFERGWMSRANSVEFKALKMAGAPALGLFGEVMDPAPFYGPGKACLMECPR